MGHKTSSTKHYRSGRQQVSAVKVPLKSDNKHDCGLNKLKEIIMVLECLKLWLLKVCQYVAKYTSQSPRYSADLLAKTLTLLLKPLVEQSKEVKPSNGKQAEGRAFSADASVTSGKQTLTRGCALSSSVNTGYQAASATLKETGEKRKKKLSTTCSSCATSCCQTSSNIQENTPRIQNCKFKKMSLYVIKNFDDKDIPRIDLHQNLQHAESDLSVGKQELNNANCYTFNLKTNRYEADMLCDSVNDNTRISDTVLPDVKFDLNEFLLKWIRSSTEASIDHNSTYIAFPVYKRVSDLSHQPTHETQTSFRFEPLTAIINRIADGERVPPQTTMKYEMLRFCTLRSYPKENKPYITRLAQAGFYYANSGDEVVCYCCARRKRNWKETDTPMAVHRELNPNCSFLTRNSEVNVPVRSQPYQDLGTSRIQQADPANNTLSDERRDIDSTANVNNSLEFARATANPYVGAAATEEGGTIQTHSKYPHSQAAENWPSSTSKYPKYSSKTVRLTSFVDCGEIVVAPECLAEAGFFYAGFGDCVRCFQCGVGLRHWSVEDDPWIEHSRWSKECSFVRQVRGVEFVNLVQMAVQYSQNEIKLQKCIGVCSSPVSYGCTLTISMKIVSNIGLKDRNHVFWLKENISKQNIQEETSARGLSCATTSNGNQSDVDNILLTDAAKCVLEMGYSPSIVRRAVRTITPKDSSANITAPNLMEQIFEIEEADNPHISASRDTETRHAQLQNTQFEDTQESNQRRSKIQQSTSRVTDVCTHKTDELSDSAIESEGQEGSAYESHQNTAQSESSFSMPKRQSAASRNDLASGYTAKSHNTKLLEQKRLKEENEKLKGQTICQKCKKKEVCIVFLPCGHLVTCADCAPTVRYCTENTCGKYIKGTVRTYLA